MINFSDDFLRKIVAKGMYLSELNNSNVLCTKSNDSEKRLELWNEKVGKENFEERIALENISYERALQLCGDVKYVGSNLPDWIKTLCDIFKLLPLNLESLRDRFSKKNKSSEFSVLYQDCFLIFVFYSRQKLCEYENKISCEILDQLCIELLNQLTGIGISVIQEYSMLLIIGNNSKTEAMRIEERMKVVPCELLYQGDYKTIFEKYPVLARILCEHTEMWIKNTCEVLSHILDEIKDQGNLYSVYSNVSDLHSDGKCVYILKYENGKKLVYKPHPLKTDIVWKKFCDKIFDLTGIKIKYVNVVDYCSHGYSEFIEYKSAYTEQQIRNFFINAGILLCAVYLTKGNDIHHENLVEHLENLYIIDTETIVQTTQQKASVKKTAMLPLYKKIDNKNKDFGGITCKLSNTYNIPQTGSIVHTARDYTNEVCSGFKQLYEALMKADCTQLQDILTDCSPRYVFRVTSDYFMVIEAISSREYLSDGFLYSCEIERFINPYIREYFNIYLSERNALLKRNIPIFYHHENSGDLYDDKGLVIKGFFRNDLCASNIFANLNDIDKDEQLKLIEDLLSERNGGLN